MRDILKAEGALAVIVLAVLWQVASRYSTPMFFPSFGTIAEAGRELLSNADTWASIGVTLLRVLAFLVLSFVLSCALGLGAAVSRRFERFVVPLVEIKQGIPGVCWVLFAILWFRNMEARIGFVVIIAALPTFFYQIRDAVKGIPRDLLDMVRSLRPSFAQLLRILIAPAVLPALLTSWRINVGNATRMTIMAELLGGISGIGQQLRQAEEVFRMDQVIVWTIVLMAFVLLSNQLLSAFERRALKWRASEGLRHD